jgi:hypothetical protein
MALANRIELAPKLSTAVQRYSAAGLSSARRLYIRFEITTAGTTVVFNIQGSNDGVTWTNLSYVTPDATVAAATTAITKNLVGVTEAFIDGLDKRFFDQYAINVTSNTGVTFKCDAYFVSGSGY